MRISQLGKNKMLTDYEAGVLYGAKLALKYLKDNHGLNLSESAIAEVLCAAADAEYARLGLGSSEESDKKCQQ